MPNGDTFSVIQSVRSAVKSDEEANKDYMAGFLAGVRTTEHEKETHKKDEQHSDDDKSAEDDEQYIMRKGALSNSPWIQVRHQNFLLHGYRSNNP